MNNPMNGGTTLGAGCNHYYPYHSPLPSWPSHVTHSWSNFSGLGGPDPMTELAKAMNRLAAAIEKQNELTEQDPA